VNSRTLCSTLLFFLALVLSTERQTAWAADSTKTRHDSPAASRKAAKPNKAAPPAVSANTLRETAERIGRRHGVRIVIDDAVRADVRAPAVAEGILPAPLLEATLRALFAGNELVFHYGVDASTKGERLKSVWVFAAAQAPAIYASATPRGTGYVTAFDNKDAEERLAALHRLSSEPPSQAQPILRRALDDPDENVRLQALQAGLANAAVPDVNALKRLVEEDSSEAVRTLALEAYVANPNASEDDVRALLDRVADDSQRMLAELARTLRESRAAPSDVAPVLQPLGDQ
jgi:hypothetical protein